MTFNIAFVLYPGFEELDFAGPYETFAAAARIVAPDWGVFTVAREPIVRGSYGLSVNADHVIDRAPDAHVLIVPGGETSTAVKDERLIHYVRKAGARAEWVLSVSTGSFMLHRAGLLDGRQATTYWAAIDQFRSLSGVTVVDDKRWVHHGKVVTAAGVSAGIDTALYVIGQLLTPRQARLIQQYMEYYPDPPYAD
jgi:transcriptional regulator GlxA family with amidase domain